MAQRQSAQQRGVIDGINDWMSQRSAQAGQFARAAEAKGRQIWENSIRTGENVLARSQSELKSLGAGSTVGTSSSSPRQGSGGQSWLDSTPAKMLGGDVAEHIGQGAGLARGAWHSAEGLGKGLYFGLRLLNPDDLKLGPGKSAWGQVLNTAIAADDYINKGLANPASVGNDIGNAIRQFDIDLDPIVTPMADTFGGELKRRFGIGANQGELGLDAASLALGSPALKALEGMGAAADATTAAEFMDMGFNPAQAERLAEPYSGWGHHTPLPRRIANKLRVPKLLQDSPLNVVKPDGINQGDFYAFHYGVDPKFSGTGFSRKIGGRWSGEDLGLQKYGQLGRLWHGTPTPLAAASLATGSAGLLNYQPAQDPAQ